MVISVRISFQNILGVIHHKRITFQNLTLDYFVELSTGILIFSTPRDIIDISKRTINKCNGISYYFIFRKLARFRINNGMAPIYIKAYTVHYSSNIHIKK